MFEGVVQYFMDKRLGLVQGEHAPIHPSVATWNADESWHEEERYNSFCFSHEGMWGLVRFGFPILQLPPNLTYITKLVLH